MVHRAESRIAATSPWLDPGYEPVDLPCVTAARADSFRDAADRVGLSLVIGCPRLLAPARTVLVIAPFALGYYTLSNIAMYEADRTS